MPTAAGAQLQVPVINLEGFQSRGRAKIVDENFQASENGPSSNSGFICLLYQRLREREDFD